ncbi:MAG: hypothetical protein JKY65_09375 [Planctomycetes bacterium]|nr:hypothetical protein [Planctomycetota bacterium]
MEELNDASETDLGEQLDTLEAELAKSPEPPLDEPGERYLWGEEVYLDALEGACFATELNRQESLTKLFRLVARGALAVMTSRPPTKEEAGEEAGAEEGEESGDRSAANPFTYIQGLSAAFVISEEGLLDSLGKVDPTADPPDGVPVGEVMLEFAATLRLVAAKDDAGARARLATLLKRTPEEMELEELYWFRLAALLDGVLSGKGDLNSLATQMAYVHKAVYSGPDLEEDPGAFLALPLAATRALGHQRGHPFEFPEELDEETLDELLNAYEGEIDPEALEPWIRAATRLLLDGESLEKASDAIRTLADGDEELAVGLAADIAVALQLVVGDDLDDDSDIDDDTTLEDLAERLVEEGIPPEAAVLILQIIASEIEAGDEEGDDEEATSSEA